MRKFLSIVVLTLFAASPAFGWETITVLPPNHRLECKVTRVTRVGTTTICLIVENARLHETVPTHLLLKKKVCPFVLRMTSVYPTCKTYDVEYDVLIPGRLVFMRTSMTAGPSARRQTPLVLPPLPTRPGHNREPKKRCMPVSK